LAYFRECGRRQDACDVLSQHDEALLTRAAPLLASWTMTGTRADVGTQLRALGSAGVTEVAYQPMGPDIPRELAAFARAAGLPFVITTERTTFPPA
jgi:hypothetical protein